LHGKAHCGGEGSQNKTPSMNFVGVSVVSYIKPMPTLGFCMVEAHLANEGEFFFKGLGFKVFNGEKKIVQICQISIK